jgi:hypothetical protein
VQLCYTKASYYAYDSSRIMKSRRVWPAPGVCRVAAWTKAKRLFLAWNARCLRTGIAPKVGNLLYVQQFTHNDKDYLEFFFHVANGQDYLHIDLSKTTHGVDEIAEIGFVDAASTKILPEFLMTEPLEEIAAVAGPTHVISRL